MTPREALIKTFREAIGEPFKVTFVHGGLLGRFDTVRSVSPAGVVKGDWTEADVEDCRFKGPQPEHLRKNTEG